VLIVGCRSGVHWTYTKRQLAFCTLTRTATRKAASARIICRRPTRPKSSGRSWASGSERISAETRERLVAFGFKKSPRYETTYGPRTADLELVSLAST
jgi:hypothetical protein